MPLWVHVLKTAQVHLYAKKGEEIILFFLLLTFFLRGQKLVILSIHNFWAHDDGGVSKADSASTVYCNKIYDSLHGNAPTNIIQTSSPTKHVRALLYVCASTMFGDRVNVYHVVVWRSIRMGKGDIMFWSTNHFMTCVRLRITWMSIHKKKIIITWMSSTRTHNPYSLHFYWTFD